MWLNKHKKSLIAGAVILAALLFAFWYGSGSPATRGGGEDVSSSVSTSAESSVDSSAAQSDASVQTEAEQKPEPEQEKPAAKPEQEKTEVKPEQKPQTEPEKKPEQKPVKKPAPKPAEKPQPKPEQKPAPKPAEKPAEKPAPKPEQKPAVKPVEKPEQVQPEPEVLTCKLSIRCDTILNHMDWLTPGKEKLVPKNGVLYAMKTVEFEEGETVFDVLLRETKKARLHMEFSNSSLYDSAYVEGIGNLYEFDCGNLSGWMYKVNNVFPQYGCSQYKLKKGDVIEWEYTCELGDDIGGGQSIG